MRLRSSGPLQHCAIGELQHSRWDWKALENRPTVGFGTGGSGSRNWGLRRGRGGECAIFSAIASLPKSAIFLAAEFCSLWNEEKEHGRREGGFVQVMASNVLVLWILFLGFWVVE